MLIIATLREEYGTIVLISKSNFYEIFFRVAVLILSALLLIVRIMDQGFLEIPDMKLLGAQSATQSMRILQKRFAGLRKWRGLRTRMEYPYVDAVFWVSRYMQTNCATYEQATGLHVHVYTCRCGICFHMHMYAESLCVCNVRTRSHVDPYVCVYIYIHMCLFVHVCKYVYTNIYIYIYIYMYNVHAGVYIHTYIYIYIYTYVYVCIYIYTDICIHMQVLCAIEVLALLKKGLYKPTELIEGCSAVQ